MHTHSDLPDLLAGPLVRRVDPERILLWLVASRPLQLSATLQPHEQASRQLRPDNTRKNRSETLNFHFFTSFSLFEKK